MRKILLLAATIAIPTMAHAAPDTCMTADDLAFMPSISKAFPVIDTAHKGCVTSEQILRYRAAVKQARAEQKARVAELLAH